MVQACIVESVQPFCAAVILAEAGRVSTVQSPLPSLPCLRDGVSFTDFVSESLAEDLLSAPFYTPT